MYNRGMRVVNCRCVYIDWVFRFNSRQISVCLLRAALLVLLESADRFAATIDGLVMHWNVSIITRYDGLWLNKLFRGRRCFSAQLHTSREHNITPERLAP